MSDGPKLHRVLLVADGALVEHLSSALEGRATHLRLCRRWDEAAPPPRLDHLESVVADFSDPVSLQRALAGCTVVVYARDPALADFSPAGELAPSSLAAAVDELRTLMLASRELSLHRFVYLSTLLTVERAPGAPPRQATPTTAYGRYRYWLELEVRKFIGLGLPALVLNPGVILGPAMPGAALIDLLRRRTLSLSLAGYVDLVDVRDFASVLVQSCEVGEVGARIVVDGHRITLSELALAVDAHDARSPLRLSAPIALASTLRRLRRKAHGDYGLDPHTFALLGRTPGCDAPLSKLLAGSLRPLAETLGAIDLDARRETR